MSILIIFGIALIGLILAALITEVVSKTWRDNSTYRRNTFFMICMGLVCMIGYAVYFSLLLGGK